MIESTVRRFAALVPMARISVPRSMPAASAGAPSNASATNTRRAAASVEKRTPKPALEPELKKAFSSAIEVMIGEEAVAPLRAGGRGQRVDIVLRRVA